MIPVAVQDVISIITHTPETIKGLIGGLDETWLHSNEGPGTWTPHEIVAHLVFGEQTDWIPRMEIILSDKEDKAFVPFDMEGHFALATGRTTESLLYQFAQLRKENIQILASANLTEDDLRLKGIHPAFGPVTMGQLLAAWVVHDMTHINQIARTIAKQYDQEVGPWKAYMGVLNR